MSSNSNNENVIEVKIGHSNNINNKPFLKQIQGIYRWNRIGYSYQTNDFLFFLIDGADISTNRWGKKWYFKITSNKTILGYLVQQKIGEPFTCKSDTSYIDSVDPICRWDYYDPQYNKSNISIELLIKKIPTPTQTSSTVEVDKNSDNLDDEDGFDDENSNDNNNQTQVAYQPPLFKGYQKPAILPPVPSRPPPRPTQKLPQAPAPAPTQQPPQPPPRPQPQQQQPQQQEQPNSPIQNNELPNELFVSLKDTANKGQELISIEKCNSLLYDNIVGKYTKYRNNIYRLKLNSYTISLEVINSLWVFNISCNKTGDNVILTQNCAANKTPTECSGTWTSNKNGIEIINKGGIIPIIELLNFSETLSK